MNKTQNTGDISTLLQSHCQTKQVKKINIMFDNLSHGYQKARFNYVSSV